MALERLQALALVWVPQNDLVVTPAARENLAVERKVDREDKIAAIFSNVREHICNGRLRLSPLNLRLSPGEGGRHATLRKGGSPMSGEGVESQLFAKCGYLWPSSFLSTLPLSTSHSRIVLSPDPLTSCDGFVGLNPTEET